MLQMSWQVSEVQGALMPWMSVEPMKQTWETQAGLDRICPVPSSLSFL